MLQLGHGFCGSVSENQDVTIPVLPNNLLEVVPQNLDPPRATATGVSGEALMALPTPMIPEPEPPQDVYANCHVRVEFDLHDDGEIESVAVQHYDAQSRYRAGEYAEGSGIRKYDWTQGIRCNGRDTDGDGQADEVYMARRDAKGNLVATASFRGNVDTPRLQYYERFHYDGRYLSRIDADMDGDLQYDRVEHLDYKLGKYYATRLDINADGEDDLRYLHEWRVDGQPARRLIDRSADGTIDRVETLLYDGEGRLTDYVISGDPDDPQSHRARYYYDERGRFVRFEEHINGAVHDWSETTYDDDDRVVEQRSSGVGRGLSVWRYSVNCGGRP